MLERKNYESISYEDDFLFFLGCSDYVCFFFPANFEGLHPHLYGLGEMIADIRIKKNESHFPAALVTTYLMAIFFAIILATLACCCKRIFRLAIFLRAWRGRLGCLIFALGLMIVPFSLIFLEMSSSATSSSGRFFEVMTRNRIALAFWCSGVFIGFSSAITTSVAAMIGFFMGEEKRD